MKILVELWHTDIHTLRVFQICSRHCSNKHCMRDKEFKLGDRLREAYSETIF